MSVATGPMTTADLLAMPDDGMDRWLIRGELREKPMTVRNRFHSETMSCVAAELLNWVRQQSPPRGRVLSGEAGVRLGGTPESTVGVDVAYVSPEVAARQGEETTLIDGAPVLAVEILSPNDTQEEIHEKLGEYLRAGVPVVWVIDPYDRTVRVYRPDARPQLFNEDQEIAGDPHLPGFRVPVARLFQ